MLHVTSVLNFVLYVSGGMCCFLKQYMNLQRMSYKFNSFLHLFFWKETLDFFEGRVKPLCLSLSLSLSGFSLVKRVSIPGMPYQAEGTLHRNL